MSLYWFAGYLDGRYTLNPIRLRGYDAAGNLLYSVRGNDIRDHDFSHLQGNSQADADAQADFADPYRFVAGVDEWGNARTLFAAVAWRGFELPQTWESVRAIAADSDGWIYCAMGYTVAAQLRDGVTEAQVRGLRADLIAQGQSRFYYGPEYEDLVVTAAQNKPAADANTYGRPYLDFFRVYRQNGDRVPFPDLHGGPVWAVACDDTYFYLAGEPVGEDKHYLRKYNKAGVQQWAAELPAWLGTKGPRYTPATTAFGVVIPEKWTFTDFQIHNILLDGSGNLYMTGTWGAWIRKYNSSGVLQWERAIPSGWEVTNVVTDGTLFYVAYYRADNWLATVYQEGGITSGGTNIYFDPVTEGPVEIVAWDADGAVVRTAVRDYYDSGGYYYLDSPQTGARRLEYHDGKLYLITLYGFDNDLVVVYDTTDLSVTTDVLSRAQYAAAHNVALGRVDFRFDANGTRVITRAEPAAPSPYTDSEGHAISNPSVGRHFFRYDAAGDQEWTDRTALGWAYPADLPNYPYAGYNSATGGQPIYATQPLFWGAYNYGFVGTAADLAIVAAPSMPMLALHYALGTPSWEGDRYTEVPGLALNLALALPDWLREYAGSVRLPDVYRLILSGSPPLEFAVSSLSLRRTAFGRQLTAVVNPPGVEALATVAARLGETLTLYRGVRFLDGTEQLESMFAVPLATVRGDRGVRSFSITLDGRAEEAEDVPQSRALSGVSYRNVGTGGQRRIRCAIDTYLKPGYTAVFGADSLVVGEVVISLSPSSGVMEVVEVAT